MPTCHARLVWPNLEGDYTILSQLEQSKGKYLMMRATALQSKLLVKD
jgi:hypothetical protein